ncbi:MAG: hydrolase 1, exosortase A system-associated [Pseudomonadota bacterium]
MSRHHLTFACGSLKLAGSLDTAPGHTGLLMVSGGNEIRSGAFCEQSQLASKVSRAGFPVFRFDRRGVGDSEGENRGFRSSARDIAAALHAFRALAPEVERVVAFGNCDAASALIITGGEGLDGLILSNPWTLDDENEDRTPPPAAIRQRYAQKLKDPAEIKRLLSGGVNLRKLASGLFKSAKPAPPPTALIEEMRAGLEAFTGNVRFLLASADRIAQSFDDAWDGDDARIYRCDGAGHSYVEPDHRQWLADQVIAALRAESAHK